MSETSDKIAYLSQCMLAERFEGMQQVLEHRTGYMTVCLENIFYGQNASAVVRSCEAFGVQQLHVVDKQSPFHTFSGIVRGTDKWVDIHKYWKQENPSLEMVRQLKTQGYRIVATSPHANDFTPETFDITKGKFAVVFGSEHAGISATIEQEADEFIKIPMYGFVESLNISVCAAILLHTLTTRLRESDLPWHLTDTEREEVLFRWMKSTVRDSKNILKRYQEIKMQE